MTKNSTSKYIIAGLLPKYLYNFIKHHSNFSLAFWKMFCYRSLKCNTTHEATNKIEESESVFIFVEKSIYWLLYAHQNTANTFTQTKLLALSLYVNTESIECQT